MSRREIREQIFKGVMQGAAEGMEDYQKIYPKP